MKAFVLKQDFDWFGQKIESGAIYKEYESTKDKFRCHTKDGLECPHWDLTFMTVRNNPHWFVEINGNMLK